MASFETRIEDNIIIFTFNHGKVNSITQETLEAMGQAIDRLNSEKELKGMILTGANKYFSGGFDLGTFTSFPTDQSIVDWFKIEEEVLYKLFTGTKPVIAAINGHATAAGMIVSMACDYRFIVNNPKIKLGMTEIKLGLALSPAEAGIMKFGLDTDKKYRDVVLGGELFDPTTAINREIYDEMVDNPEDLLVKAKAKICSFIDHPGRAFMGLKVMEKRDRAAIIRRDIDEFDWNVLVELFTNDEVVNTLKMVKQALGV